MEKNRHERQIEFKCRSCEEIVKQLVESGEPTDDPREQYAVIYQCPNCGAANYLLTH